MKRFVTYLYAYRNGQKIKNTGHIRVDLRGQMLDMRISIKDAELDNTKGNFYLVIRKESTSAISMAEIPMKNGLYNGRIVCDASEHEEVFQLEEVIGVCVCYKNDCYLASCWKDGEEEVIAEGKFFESAMAEDVLEDIREELTENIVENIIEDLGKVDDAIETEILDEPELPVIAAAIPEQEEASSQEGTFCLKINLNEIYNLPSNCWHFSNNSFLLHGFWNYGYLVVKEEVAENAKRTSLGVPGVFEHPEMVMATYFGFTEFEALPSQVVEMEIGQKCAAVNEQKNQPPQNGTFGCWFANL